MNCGNTHRDCHPKVEPSMLQHQAGNATLPDTIHQVPHADLTHVLIRIAPSSVDRRMCLHQLGSPNKATYTSVLVSIFTDGSIRTIVPKGKPG